jgi:hypothetical protein
MSSKWKVLLPKNQDQDREEQEGNLQVEVGNHQKSPEDGLLIRLITKIKMIIILILMIKIKMIIILMIKLTMRMRMLIWISL